MQAVVLVMLLGVSLHGVCGNEGDQSNSDTLSIIKAMKDEMKTLQDQVQSLVQQQSSPQVAFHAGLYNGALWKKYGPFNTEITLKYERVLTNIGEGYNPVTGFFTAPLKGVYVFHYTMHLDSRASNWSKVNLKKNTESLVENLETVSDSDGDDSGSHVAVVTLEQGDTVSVVLRSNSAFHDYEGQYNTFSGFLLFPMSSQ